MCSEFQGMVFQELTQFTRELTEQSLKNLKNALHVFVFPEPVWTKMYWVSIP